MAVELRPLQPSHNEAILDAIRNEGTSQYQQRIPNATKAGVQATMKAMNTYNGHYNEFLDALINRIGSVVVRNLSWTNPFSEFKQGMLEYGDTIEEVQVGLLKAFNYKEDHEQMEKDIWGVSRPDVQSNFHTVNRQDTYKITINEAELRRAFLSPTGLYDFITKLMQAPTTSDQWDEFLLMTSLFAEYESNGGFWHVNVPDVRNLTSDSADAKQALRKMRAMADTLLFPSSRYNAAHMPTFAKREDLVIFVSPEYAAAVDVEALAGAFNMDKTSMHGRILPIPQEQIGITNAQAIMTTKDYFVVADQLLENRSIANPMGMYSNYFLHHWQIQSVSRFVPAVMFWTGADDEVIEISPVVDTVAAPLVYNRATPKVAVTTLERGQMYDVDAVVATDPTGGINTAVVYTVTGGESARTYVTQDRVLHIGGDETSDGVGLTATSVWIDPANPSAPKVTSTTSTLTITGVMLPQWPASPEFIGLHDYVLGDFVKIGEAILEVTTAGTSGAAAPAVPGVGETVASGTVTFTRRT
jgi:hypothetical protein